MTYKEFKHAWCKLFLRGKRCILFLSSKKGEMKRYFMLACVHSLLYIT